MQRLQDKTDLAAGNNELAMKSQSEEKSREEQGTFGERLSQSSLPYDGATRESGSNDAVSRPSHENRILCVDDELAGTIIRGEILKEQGYTVVLCHCPFAALSCDLSEFDVAILDYQMPGLNGQELLLRMRALGARFPIILLTGCLDVLSYDDRRLFARCIDKSMPIQHLLEVLKAFLDSHQIPDYGG